MSLYNNGVQLLYPRCHHPRQLFAAEGKRVYTDFARTPFKETTFHTLAHFSLYPSTRATSQPLPQWRSHQLLYAPRLRSNVCRRVYANGYGTCLRLLCARVCTRICIHVCIPLCVATVELCSNCAKLRISVSDELRDLQYNCATFSLLSLHPIPPLSTRLCRRVRKNYSLVQDICAAYVWYRGVYVYVLARATCTNKHGRATPRNIGVLYPGTRYLRKRITR